MSRLEEAVQDADFIFEVIIEKLDAKKDIFESKDRFVIKYVTRDSKISHNVQNCNNVLHTNSIV